MICDSFSPLEAFAEEMVSLQSFDFSSFAQSRSHLTLGPYSCDFDRLSLHIYSHNLCSNEYRKLGLFLKEKFPLSHTKEDIKAMREIKKELMKKGYEP